jgi:hypothetical protein
MLCSIDVQFFFNSEHICTCGCAKMIRSDIYSTEERRIFKP